MSAPTQQLQPLLPEPDFSWPPELNQLETASATGNVDVLRTYFFKWHSESLEGKHPLRSLSPALAAAVMNNQVSCVSYLLDQGVPMIQGLFLRATEMKSYPILQAFLEHGLDINTPMSALTPPALAFAVGDEALMNWFLDHHADPNSRCNRDETPLSWAIRSAPFSNILILLNRGGIIQRGQLLHYAAQRELPDRLEVMNFLLEKGYLESINKIMYQDRWEDYVLNMRAGIGTPLHFAAANGLLDLVKLLVDKGADPLVKDPAGLIALDWALWRGQEEVAEFLRPLSVPSSVPRQDFSDGPGLHWRGTPLQDVLKSGKYKAVYLP